MFSQRGRTYDLASSDASLLYLTGRASELVIIFLEGHTFNSCWESSDFLFLSVASVADGKISLTKELLQNWGIPMFETSVNLYL